MLAHGENDKKLNGKENKPNVNDDEVNYLLKEDLKMDKNNSPCDKCISHNGELSFIFSCSHNICIMCIFNYFISSNFKGLNYEFISINCPKCKYGAAKFDLEVWIKILDQMYSKNNKNKDNIDSNAFCNVHKNNKTTKYCNQCKKYLCQVCLKNNHNKI